MPRFFIDYIPEERAILTGPDAHHIAKSLRMRPGEPLILCDSIGTDYNCEIEQIDGETVTVKVLNFCRSVSEPSVFVTLYQAFPKADKMDAVVQKSVELGVSRIVPMLSERCVSRPDEKAVKKKADRWQKIAEEAAKQSGRGVIPQVAPSLPFRAAIQEAEKAGEILFFYEGGLHRPGGRICRGGGPFCPGARRKNRNAWPPHFAHGNRPHRSVGGDHARHG